MFVYKMFNQLKSSYLLRNNSGMSLERRQVIIVGGGPAGLTAAIYMARANLNPLVAVGQTEGTLLPGGQLMLTSEIENFPGFPDGIEGCDLMKNMEDQAKKFGAVIVEKWATDFKIKQGGPFGVKIGDEWHETESIVFANGASAKWLNAPDEKRLRNRGISACATCDGPLPVFRNKHLFVVGGGDSAMQEALFLTRFASKVTIVHRRDKLRASKIMQARVIENGKIDVLFDTTILGYIGENFLEKIIFKNVVTEQVEQVEAGGLFMAIGHEPSVKYIKDKGIDLDEHGYIKVHDDVLTNVDGVFAAGDVHDNVYRQAITAAGFGCMAALAAEKWLDAKGIKF